MDGFIDLNKRHCYNCIYFMTGWKFDCRFHNKDVSPSDDICDDFKEKVFTQFTIDNWETVIRNHVDDEEYGVNGVVYKLNELYYLNQELYQFRLYYNALLFNTWHKNGTFEVYKSKKHHDGEPCFGGEWFVVVALLPGGQITNHYHINDWDLFRIPITTKVYHEFDGHTSQDVLDRLRDVI